MQKDPNISDLDRNLIERMVKELKLHNTSTGRAARYVNHLLVAGRKIHEITDANEILTHAPRKTWTISKSG